MSATKTSITVDEENWKLLKNRKNRSSVINAALSLYFLREPYLAEAEEAFWKKVDASLSGENSDFVLLAGKNEELTDELLEEKLWS